MRRLRQTLLKQTHRQDRSFLYMFIYVSRSFRLLFFLLFLLRKKDGDIISFMSLRDTGQQIVIRNACAQVLVVSQLCVRH